MTYTVKLTDQAKMDLRGIYEYIALTLLEPETAKNIAVPGPQSHHIFAGCGSSPQ